MTKMLNIKTGQPADLPIRVILYGPHGVGKTGFGADAPAPIFLPLEEGLDAYPNAVAFPKPDTLDDVYDAIALLSRGAPQLADRKTLVIDTLDALDAMILLRVRMDAKGQNRHLPALEEIGGGFNKGAKRALEIWQDLTVRLDALQAKRKMNLVMLAHASTEKVKQPSGEDITRHSLKLMGHQAGAHLKEWSREVLFACFETRGKGKWVKQSLEVAKRVIYTTQVQSGAFDAKNRVGLPPKLPLSFHAYAEARAEGLRQLTARGNEVDPDLVNEVRAAMAQLPEEKQIERTTKRPLVELAAEKGNVALRKLLNWAISKADEIAGDSENAVTSGVRPREDESDPSQPSDNADSSSSVTSGGATPGGSSSAEADPSAGGATQPPSGEPQPPPSGESQPAPAQEAPVSSDGSASESGPAAQARQKPAPAVPGVRKPQKTAT